MYDYCHGCLRTFRFVFCVLMLIVMFWFDDVLIFDVSPVAVVFVVVWCTVFSVFDRFFGFAIFFKMGTVVLISVLLLGFGDVHCSIRSAASYNFAVNSTFGFIFVPVMLV